MNHIDLLIGGKDVKAAASYDRIDPVTGEIASRAAAASVAEALKAADAAQAALPGWAALGPNERRARLLKAAELFRANGAEFGRLMVTETGGTAGWGGFNAMLAANMLTEAASMTTQISGEVIPSDVPGNLATAIRVPAGVVLGIAPWNAPVILGTRALAMPLACGNTVVLKASELCPGTHRLIGTLLQQAGLGDGVVNVVTNAPADAGAIVAALIAHPAVRRINFTGSTRVGKIIAKLAAEQLKPVLLELGGKAPFLVLDDADLDEAVKAAAFGAFFNQGQICMSTERIVVDPAIADEFVARFTTKTKSLTASNPRDNNTVLGAMISTEAANHVAELMHDALSKGAVLQAGGSYEGAIFQPTLIDRVTPEMRLYAEESFGPIAVIVRAKDLEDAVHIANDTEYGLSAAVFGRDISRAYQIAGRIQSGICHINGPTVQDEAQMPFGGVKGSGYGRFGGKAAIAEFTDLRWITTQLTHRHYPI